MEPKTCLICSAPLDKHKKKFCSKQCRAISDRGNSYAKKKPTYKECLLCGKNKSRFFASYQNGYLCDSCYYKERWKKIKLDPIRYQKELERVHANNKRNYPNRKISLQKLSVRFTTAKRLAKKRNKEWVLTLEEYKTIASQPCYYCMNKICSPVNQSIGLDRIDNNRGYSADNVVSCGYICNAIRGENLSSEEMKEVAALLIKLRAQTASPDSEDKQHSLCSLL